MCVFPGPHHLGAVFVINQFPPAVFYATEWRILPVVGKPVGPKTAPVIRDHLVERIHDIVEGVGLNHGRSAGRAMKQPAEIVEGLRALGLLANNRVRPEPVEFAFIVEINGPPPRFPLMRSVIQLRGIVRGILQVAPGFSRTMVEAGGHPRQIPTILIWSPNAASPASTSP